MNKSQPNISNFSRLTDEEKIKRLQDIRYEYPEEHPEYKKITVQINKLSAKGFKND